MIIRSAERRDLPAILAIYNEAVLSTTATYDYEPQSLAQRTLWFEDHINAQYPIIVAESDPAQILGWGALSQFHPKPGYRFTAENTLYVRSEHQGQGIGRRLLSALIEAGSRRQLRMLMALIDAENVASLKLHASLGYERAGHFSEVGFKFGRWLDVVFMQLRLPEA